MTVRPNPGEVLPELVVVSHQMVIEDAAALRAGAK